MERDILWWRVLSSGFLSLVQIFGKPRKIHGVHVPPPKDIRALPSHECPWPKRAGNVWPATCWSYKPARDQGYNTFWNHNNGIRHLPRSMTGSELGNYLALSLCTVTTLHLNFLALSRWMKYYYHCCKLQNCGKTYQPVAPNHPPDDFGGGTWSSVASTKYTPLKFLLNKPKKALIASSWDVILQKDTPDKVLFFYGVMVTAWCDRICSY